jgi:hypothetical protein
VLHNAWKTAGKVPKAANNNSQAYFTEHEQTVLEGILSPYIELGFLNLQIHEGRSSTLYTGCVGEKIPSVWFTLLKQKSTGPLVYTLNVPWNGTHNKETMNFLEIEKALKAMIESYLDLGSNAATVHQAPFLRAV